MDSADTVLDIVMECYLIEASKMAKRRCLVCPNDNCYETNDGGARKSDV
jgi:hypothetical protein